MLARLTPAALVALVLLAAGCGGNDGRREAISAYFDQVNAVQARMAGPLLEVSKANRAFAQGKSDPAKLRKRLARSEQTFRTLGRRLDAIDPPPDARELQRLLVELVRRQGQLAHETATLAAFIPAFGAALAPVAPAGRDLKAALDGKGSVEEKADALDRYGARLGAALARLRPLDAPPSSRASYDAQVRTLERVRASVAALARALREKQTAKIGPLLHRFDLAAVSNQSLAAQRAQIAGVRAYNQRVKALDRLVVRIAKERTRLQRLVR